MGKFYVVIILAAISGLLLISSGCGTSPSGTTTNPAQTPITSSSPAGPTFGSYAQSGETVFSTKCAGCHGAIGEGKTAPAVIGSSAGLGKYTMAKGLLDFISTTMPMRAPGSLSHQDYVNVLCYLLVQNNLAGPSTAFDENALSTLQLK